MRMRPDASLAGSLRVTKSASGHIGDERDRAILEDAVCPVPHQLT